MDAKWLAVSTKNDDIGGEVLLLRHTRTAGTKSSKSHSEPRAED